MLHDLDKANCMTLVYKDGRKVAVTWDEWISMFSGSTKEELVSFCEDQGIEQISYYQQTEAGTRTHGKVTADRLRGRDDVPKIVVDAIEEHELAFTFGARGGINIPLIENMVQGKDDITIGFTFAVNYADQMGSYREDGKPDITDFLLMSESFVAFRKLQELTARLVITERLDTQKVEKILAILRKATDAFRGENVDEAYSRIAQECKLPQVTDDQVRKALANAIVSGMSPEIVEAIVVDMTTTGKLSGDTGKQLGKFNKDVRAVLAKISK